MTKDEALKLALEALETCDGGTSWADPYQRFDKNLVIKTIAAIKQALAAPVQEPDEVLLKFYDAKDYPGLVAEMERHIERLQAKLPKTPPFAHQRVREG